MVNENQLEFLNKIKILQNNININKVINFIFETIYEKIKEEQYQWIDEVLLNVTQDTESYNEDSLLSFLTITLTTNDKYQNRNHYFIKIKEVFTNRLGHEKTFEILRGLEKYNG